MPTENADVMESPPPASTRTLDGIGIKLTGAFDCPNTAGPTKRKTTKIAKSNRMCPSLRTLRPNSISSAAQNSTYRQVPRDVFRSAKSGSARF